MGNADLILNEILLEGTDVLDATGQEFTGDDPFAQREAPYDDGTGMEAFDEPESSSADLGEPEAMWGGFEAGDESLLSSSEEDNLAYEYMSLQSEEEMEEFLGKIFKKIKKKVPFVGKFLKGPGRALLARAMPLIGSAAGSVIPGLGTALGGAAGSALGSMIAGKKGGVRAAAAGMLGAANPVAALVGSGAAGNVLGKLLGGEMENATLQEAKLDLAKRLVRTVTDAAKDVANDPNVARNAGATARAALSSALQRHVPPAVRATIAAAGASGMPSGSGQAQGRWMRRGNRIVLLGV